MTKAFTLIELAIVIVVIGIITSVVIGANSLIESSKRTKVVSQITEFKQAILAFKLEFDDLPGDLPNSWDYFDLSEFPEQHRSNCHRAGHHCNSSKRGDGIISRHTESSMAWIELSKAKILPEGKYKHNGESWNDSLHLYCGVNTPEGPYQDTCWQITDWPNTYNIPLKRNNWLIYGSEKGASGWEDNLFGYSMSPKDAYAIDKKIDDEEPMAGNFIANEAIGVDASYSASVNNETGQSSYNSFCSTDVFGGTYPSRASRYVLDHDMPICRIGVKLD
jgi:prepilin-type N-terminal cleavage/methylation domain-containing protein